MLFQKNIYLLVDGIYLFRLIKNQKILSDITIVSKIFRNRLKPKHSFKVEPIGDHRGKL
ncbi:hypothetical protein NUACC26_084280 [Scytonema sp. NUACC26]